MPPQMLGQAPVNEGGSGSSSGFQIMAPPGRTAAGAGRGGGGKGAYHAFQGDMFLVLFLLFSLLWGWF